MKAIILCRCSTDEVRQDTELQIKPCKEYCEKQGWSYDVVDYYGSASKIIPERLQEVLNLIAQRKYDVIVVYSMDRFSRLHPRITEKMLNHITECKCRFISILEGLDSENLMMWYAMKGLWIYFANLYSVNLSIKIKAGMLKAKAEGKPIGRKKGSKDKRVRSKKGYYNRKYKFKLNKESKVSPLNLK
jgi:DNA invertase Pin-like site-specific DNA recombinase